MRTDKQIVAEVQHQGKVIRAMGAAGAMARPHRPTSGSNGSLVYVGWQWPGPRIPAVFREELAAAKLVRRTMGRDATGFDVLNRRARNAAERATGAWVPTFQFSFSAKDDDDLEELERRARQLTGVEVTVYRRGRKQPARKRLRSAAA